MFLMIRRPPKSALLPSTTPFRSSGFKNGEHESDLTSAPSCDSGASATSPVPGPYAITCSGAASGNYKFSYEAGQLTLTKAPLTVSADDTSREYGDANPALTHHISGFKNGEHESDLTSAPSCDSAAGAASPVPGPYAITCSGAASGNYDFSYEAGQLTLTKAPLTVAADDASREYGDANPAFTHHISGFKNGEHESDLTSAPGCHSGASATSPVPGPYAITCSGAASGNYDFSYQAGQLTLTKAPLIVAADDASREYGDANPAFTHHISGFKNGEHESDLTSAPGCHSGASATSPVPGPYAITCSGAASGNYDFSYQAGQLTLTKAPLIVAADDASREYGDANPAFTHHFSGFKNGEHESDLTSAPSCDSAASATSPVPGPYAITCSGAASGNYDVTYE